MTIVIPFTFTAGTKAKASEVNQNFSVAYSAINSNASNIVSLQADVDSLDTDKADVNGSTSNRFAVADPVNNTDAVNKEYLIDSITNSLGYIDGLILSKNDATSLVYTAGSCYDSTNSYILQVSSSGTVTNSSQSASTIYYVYIIGKEPTSGIIADDCELYIYTSSVNPSLPSGYDYYKLVGSYTTGATSYAGNTIININSYSNSIHTVDNYFMPDYNNGTSKSFSTIYQAEKNGWLYTRGSLSNNKYYQIVVNDTLSTGSVSGLTGTYLLGTTIAYTYIVDVGNTAQMYGQIKAGQYYSVYGTGSNVSTYFYPLLGR